MTRNEKKFVDSLMDIISPFCNKDAKSMVFAMKVLLGLYVSYSIEHVPDLNDDEILTLGQSTMHEQIQNYRSLQEKQKND